MTTSSHIVIDLSSHSQYSFILSSSHSLKNTDLTSEPQMSHDDALNVAQRAYGPVPYEPRSITFLPSTFSALCSASRKVIFFIKSSQYDVIYIVNDSHDLALNRQFKVIGQLK